MVDELEILRMENKRLQGLVDSLMSEVVRLRPSEYPRPNTSPSGPLIPNFPTPDRRGIGNDWYQDLTGRTRASDGITGITTTTYTGDGPYTVVGGAGVPFLGEQQANTLVGPGSDPTRAPASFGDLVTNSGRILGLMDEIEERTRQRRAEHVRENLYGVGPMDLPTTVTMMTH